MKDHKCYSGLLWCITETVQDPDSNIGLDHRYFPKFNKAYGTELSIVTDAEMVCTQTPIIFRIS